MKIGILGVGHFATVVAFCLQRKGHEVRHFDDPPYLVRDGQPHEAGIPAFVEVSPGEELPNCDLIWAAYDTPLDADGRGRDRDVIERITTMLRYVEGARAVVLLSPQWRVGSTRTLETRFPQHAFVYVMENVRVGHAIADFLDQRAIVVGLRNGSPFGRIDFLQAFGEVCAVSVESAEMAKHALNCQMALQIAWINEIARLCRVVDADPDQVALVLKLDRRVSPHAPLAPGAPFGGGSLKRDVLALQAISLGSHAGVSYVREWTPIINAILASNIGAAEVKR